MAASERQGIRKYIEISSLYDIICLYHLISLIYTYYKLQYSFFIMRSEDFLDEAQRQARAKHRQEAMSEVCLKERLGCLGQFKIPGRGNENWMVLYRFVLLWDQESNQMGVQLGVGKNGNAWNINKIKCLKKKEQQTDARKYAMEREQRIKAIRNTNFLDLGEVPRRISF